MFKIITNRCSQCSGIMFGQLSNTGDYYCKCSYAEIEKPSYTAQDMEAFAEWCALMEWIYDPTDKVWFQKYSTETKTTAQLRKLWEQEMDVNTSEPPNSKQQCPTCGSDSLITLSDITYCMNDCCDGVKGHN